MKKGLILLAVVPALCLSCFKEKHHNVYSFALDNTFEYQQTEFDPTDSTWFPEFFASQGAPVGFMGKISEDGKQLLGGFGLSRGVDPVISESEEPKTPWHCIAPSLYSDEKTFAVFRESDDMPEGQVLTSLLNAECTVAPAAVLVNNTTRFVRAVRLGTGLEGGAFAEGDWATLTFTGYLNKVKTGSVSVSLADFQTYRDSVVTTWTPVVLKDIGNIDAMTLSFSSSRADMVRDVCLDHFLFSCHIEY